MKLTIVLVSRGGHEQNFEMETRRAPRNLDALIEASYNAKHTVLTNVLENGGAAYILSFSENSADDLQSAVNNDEYSDLSGCDLSIGEVEDLIEDNIDSGDNEATIYVYELPETMDEDEDEYEDEDGDEDGDDAASDRELLTVVVKIHGGGKATVHVPHGTSFERVIQKSGLAMPAGASYAFNGNDVSPQDGVGAGGQLTAAGKVVGG